MEFFGFWKETRACSVQGSHLLHRGCSGNTVRMFLCIVVFRRLEDWTQINSRLARE